MQDADESHRNMEGFAPLNFNSCLFFATEKPLKQLFQVRETYNESSLKHLIGLRKTNYFATVGYQMSEDTPNQPRSINFYKANG